MFGLGKKEKPEAAPKAKTYTENELKEFAKEIINSTQDDLSLRQRMAQTISGGYDYSDRMHNVYCDFGYPNTLNFSNFWNMYRRLGIAKNVVELPVDTAWLSQPTVEGSEQFNRDFEELVKEFKFWDRSKRIRQSSAGWPLCWHVHARA